MTDDAPTQHINTPRPEAPATISAAVAANTNILCLPRRQLSPDALLRIKQATAILVKEQNLTLVDEYFASGAVGTQRVLGVLNSKPLDDFFWAIVRGGTPVPLHSSFRLSSFKKFVTDGSVFRDAHAMVDVLALSSREAGDFFYIVATLISDETWREICAIVAYGWVPEFQRPVLLAVCLQFGRHCVEHDTLDVLDAQFDKPAWRALRLALVNTDWRQFTLSAIDAAYQNGTEMRTTMRAMFEKVLRKQTFKEFSMLISQLIPLRYGETVTVAMIKATISESILKANIITEKDIADEYNRQQRVRYAESVRRLKS